MTERVAAMTPPSPTIGRAVLAVAAAANVASLLAWVFGLGPFRTWFVAVSIPSLATLTVVAVVAMRRDAPIRHVLAAGTLGGLIGTLGYDLFRVPFILAGLRLFAPIDSYGVLLLGADSSSPLTSFAGWSYHVANGIGFGIAYALVAFGRRWHWAVLWAMALETATVATPFAGYYGLRGRWDIIAISYAAHLAYGVPLGLMVQRAGRRPRPERSGLPTWAAIGAVVIGLAAWLQPGRVPVDVRLGREVALGPSAIVRDGRLVPEWLRVSPDGCASVENLDDVGYEMSEPYGWIAPGATIRLCDSRTGAHRVRVGSRPYSGGFLLVDPEA